jgi:periplasmic protein TonB
MSEHSSTFNASAALSINDALLIAIFFAAIAHALIILGISFNVPQQEKTKKSISITLANSPSQKAPEKAQFLAQQNQQGAGSKNTKVKPKPLQQKIPSQGRTNKKQLVKREAAAKTQPAKKVLIQEKSDVAINSSQKSTTSVSKNKPQLSTEALARQIAQLGATIRHQKPSAENSRIKFVNSVSTHKYLAAQYIMDWQNKVERTGNLNYPEIARKKHFTGSLKMDVGINQDGSIYSIRISKSSGYKALDDAAKRIVQISAPFAPLPKELRKELDVLVITRVWQFSDEYMSAQ